MYVTISAQNFAACCFEGKQFKAWEFVVKLEQGNLLMPGAVSAILFVFTRECSPRTSHVVLQVARKRLEKHGHGSVRAPLRRLARRRSEAELLDWV